jgi:hypothetical protein
MEKYGEHSKEILYCVEDTVVALKIHVTIGEDNFLGPGLTTFMPQGMSHKLE